MLSCGGVAPVSQPRRFLNNVQCCGIETAEARERRLYSSFFADLCAGVKCGAVVPGEERPSPPSPLPRLRERGALIWAPITSHTSVLSDRCHALRLTAAQCPLARGHGRGGGGEGRPWNAV